MRRNYYEQPEWEPQSPAGPRAPAEPVSPPAPPPASGHSAPPAEPAEPALSQRVTPYLEEPPRRTPEAWRRPPRRADPDQSRGFRGFLLCLSIVLIFTGVGLYLRMEDPSSVPSLGDFGWVWDQWDLPGSWGYYGPWGEENWEDNWLEELEDTTAPRAAVGDGTVLTLAPEGGESLAPQVIYQQLSPAVVGIRAQLQGGYSLGTGIVMSEEGYIITNAHVIAGSRSLEVVLTDNSRRSALLVGYDGESDLAVLKIPAGGLTTARFGDSTLLQVGEPAYAIGNPLGEELRGTMTDGIISAIDRPVDMGDGTGMTLIQTTAALNSGNSGGALINAAGQVVGITNMKMMAQDETIEGLGFAIPTATAKEVVDQIIAQGFYDGRPMLGVGVSDRALEREDLPAGVYVESVEPGSDAYEKGIRPGDVILRAGGLELGGTADLETAKAGLGVGDSLLLEVWTDGEVRTVEVELVGSRRLAR